MSWLLDFWRTTVGAKIVMAVTGVILFGFTIVHTIGNLQVYLGREVFNDYAAMLHGMPEVLWLARLGLLAAVILHIWSWLRVRAKTAAARPVAYKKLVPQASTLYSRTMRISGPIVLLFIVFHLLHMTVGLYPIHPSFRMVEPDAPDAFHNLTAGLAVIPVGVVYIVSNVLLGLHLWHGAFSLCRTLGLAGGRQLVLARNIATALTVLVAGGNVLIATTILLGLVK